MNEILFLLQIFCIFSFSLVALRLGKEALYAGITIQALLANFFVLKQMHLFGCTVTCSDAFAVGSILGINLLREYFGQKDAKKAILICFLFMIFFAVMSELHLFFIPSTEDTTHLAYARLLFVAPRLLFSSLSVFFIIQHFDTHFFGWLTRHFPTMHFSLRSSFSIAVSQFLDTFLFSLIGLYGLVDHLWDIILVSFFIKFLVIICLGPLTLFFKKTLPQYDDAI